MVKWELKTYEADIRDFFNKPVPSILWKTDKKTIKTAWDELQEMANDGWELVSVTPINYDNGHTGILLYTFKRPKPDTA